MPRVFTTALLASLFAIASASAQSPERDSAQKKDSVIASDGIRVAVDTARTVIPPVHLGPSVITKPIHRSKACGTLPQWKCAVGGALVGLVAGTMFGYLSQPDPVYQDTNTILGTLTQCYDNCDNGFPFFFALSGTAVGGMVGWLLGR